MTLYGLRFGSVVPTDAVVGPTTVDRARHLEQNWRALATLWSIELAAYMLLAVAGATLLARTAGGARWCPRPVAWALVVVGALLQSVMYAFMLGGYPAAIPVARGTPALFEAMNSSAILLFNASNLSLSLGVTALFAAEASDGALLPRKLGWAGATLYVLGVLATGAIAAARGLAAAAPVAGAAYLLFACLGIALARSTRGTAEPG